jgi:hypothetical protein
MTKAIIYRPSKTAMQSGTAKTKRWYLEYQAENPRFIEPLMGWTGTHETTQQVSLGFATRDAAVAYAESRGLAYEIRDFNERPQQPKLYADNFRFDRIRASEKPVVNRKPEA